LEAALTPALAAAACCSFTRSEKAGGAGCAIAYPGSARKRRSDQLDPLAAESPPTLGPGFDGLDRHPLPS